MNHRYYNDYYDFPTRRRRKRYKPKTTWSLPDTQSEIQTQQPEVVKEPPEDQETESEAVSDPTQSCESKYLKGSGCTVSIDLSDDLYDMLEKGHFVDVSIKCGSGVFRAHKTVLCARSPVFEAMFTSPMQENIVDEVVVDDIEHSVFRTMLTFMYCGQLEDLTVPFACDLLYAAEKYQIKLLKEICVSYLQSILSEDNVFDILQCADLYDKDLKLSTLNFIGEHFCALKDTDKWKTIQSEYQTLAIEVYSHVVNILQEKMEVLTSNPS